MSSEAKALHCVVEHLEGGRSRAGLARLQEWLLKPVLTLYTSALLGCKGLEPDGGRRNDRGGRRGGWHVAWPCD